MNRVIGRAIIVAMLVMGLGATSAYATSITFNFQTGSSDDGSVGNQRSFSSGGVTVYAMAWYFKSSQTSYRNAGLGRYSSGLAVCNSDEDGSHYPCDGPDHAIDNDRENDFVLFLFDQDVDLTSLDVIEVSHDTDVSYWTGTVAGLASQTGLLSSKSLSNLAALGFGSQQNDNGNNDRTVTLNSPLNAYNALLIGASYQQGDEDDYFKIKSLTINYTPELPQTPTAVPEPASFVLLGCGLVGLAARRRLTARQR